MRFTVFASALILAASVSAASAQQTPDVVSNAPAKPPVPAQPKATAAPAAAAPIVFSVNGNSVIQAAAARTPEQRKADAEAETMWQARCRPVVVEDREGIRRVQYADRDCDLSPFNTAGR